MGKGAIIHKPDALDANAFGDKFFDVLFQENVQVKVYLSLYYKVKIRYFENINILANIFVRVHTLECILPFCRFILNSSKIRTIVF